MSDSALEAIETSIVAELALVTGMASVRAVPLSLAFSFKEREDGTVYMDHKEVPHVYDGAIVCINDADIKPHYINQQGSTSTVGFTVPVVIAFYAQSNGEVAGAAHRRAWKLYEASLRRLSVFTPQAGFPAGSQGLAPLKPGDFEAIPIDANTHGIASYFNASFQIEVITP